MQPLKFKNGYVIPPHALLGVWSLINAGIKVNHVSKRNHRGWSQIDFRWSHYIIHYSQPFENQVFRLFLSWVTLAMLRRYNVAMTCVPVAKSYGQRCQMHWTMAPISPHYVELPIIERQSGPWKAWLMIHGHKLIWHWFLESRMYTLEMSSVQHVIIHICLW